MAQFRSVNSTLTPEEAADQAIAGDSRLAPHRGAFLAAVQAGGASGADAEVVFHSDDGLY
jgi:hypothetical protein